MPSMRVHRSIARISPAHSSSGSLTAVLLCRRPEEAHSSEHTISLPDEAETLPILALGALQESESCRWSSPDGHICAAPERCLNSGDVLLPLAMHRHRQRKAGQDLHLQASRSSSQCSKQA